MYVYLKFTMDSYRIKDPLQTAVVPSTPRPIAQKYPKNVETFSDHFHFFAPSLYWPDSFLSSPEAGLDLGKKKSSLTIYYFASNWLHNAAAAWSKPLGGQLKEPISSGNSIEANCLERLPPGIQKYWPFLFALRIFDSGKSFGVWMDFWIPFVLNILILFELFNPN